MSLTNFKRNETTNIAQTEAVEDNKYLINNTQHFVKSSESHVSQGNSQIG